MHMAERHWAEAATDFFEAFKNYDEAGNQRRDSGDACVGILRNALMEIIYALPYVSPLAECVSSSLTAFVQNIDTQSNRRTIMDDPFSRNYVEDLLKNIRTQVLLKLIKPYTRIRIPLKSNVSYSLPGGWELNVPEQDVEQLLVSLILDNRINRHIDQVYRLLERWDRSKGTKKDAAVEQRNM
ncbi:COP9 signalosome complex subunit 2 [Morella rubra]|uniref:COP9 signalosome complex subunit 2 n=1 Tax=Morella rubra TaxID=262757 RepID=A0A6A1VLA9_9ROSI|nr:COP9 signalosome complex subunit 2 [Morella rubra]